jgi:regulatory protein
MSSSNPSGNTLDKARKYCAVQERCIQQVKDKLKQWGTPPGDMDAIISSLISDQFINEERFASLYARSKFNQLGWGKTKIIMMLRHSKISEEWIANAIDELDSMNYESKIKTLLQKKRNSLKSLNDPLITKKKLIAFGLSKGFERDLLYQVVKELNN